MSWRRGPNPGSQARVRVCTAGKQSPSHSDQSDHSVIMSSQLKPDGGGAAGAPPPPPPPMFS